MQIDDTSIRYILLAVGVVVILFVLLDGLRRRKKITRRSAYGDSQQDLSTDTNDVTINGKVPSHSLDGIIGEPRPLTAAASVESKLDEHFNLSLTEHQQHKKKQTTTPQQQKKQNKNILTKQQLSQSRSAQPKSNQSSQEQQFELPLDQAVAASAYSTEIHIELSQLPTLKQEIAHIDFTEQLDNHSCYQYSDDDSSQADDEANNENKGQPTAVANKDQVQETVAAKVIDSHQVAPSLAKTAADPVAMSAVDSEEIAESAPMMAAVETVEQVTEKSSSQKVLKDGFIVLHVQAPTNHPFAGYRLLQTLLAHRLQFGKQGLFHYYQQTEAGQKILFSVASAADPGYFDLSTMASFQCETLVFFMNIDSHVDVSNDSNSKGCDNSAPLAAFDQMLLTAQQFATDMQAVVKVSQQPGDDSHKIQQLRQAIIEYRR